MKTQTIRNAVQAIQSAMSAGDSLKSTLTFIRTLFFKLSRRDWSLVEAWAKAEYNTGVKS